jgi:heme exporter protein C
MNLPRFIIRLAAPKHFYSLIHRLIPWLFGAGLVFLAYGLVGGLYLAPPDYQQGDGFRIIYIHVPCAILSLSIYLSMAFCATMAFIWRIKIYDYLLIASAPVGALMTLLALVTGAIWGKPMWGTYWVWDARLTSELVQLFLYLGVIGLENALRGQEQSTKMLRILVLVGSVNIPIVHFSVYWWNTLHQGGTLKLLGPSMIAPSMLHPLLSMIVALTCIAAWLILIRARNEVLCQEKRSYWVKEMVTASKWL